MAAPVTPRTGHVIAGESLDSATDRIDASIRPPNR